MPLGLVSFGDHAMRLGQILQSPLTAEPTHLFDGLQALRSDLLEASAPTTAIDSLLLCLDHIPWGDDICHQVCDGLSMLLRLSAFQPGPTESTERLYGRYLATLDGRARSYETVQPMSQREFSTIERVLASDSGGVFVRKTFHGGHSFGLAYAGFFNEARFSLKMGRRCAVPAQDFGVSPEGHPFLILESMTGDLRTVFDPRRRRDVHREAVKLTSLLLYLHVHRIIHRDIKPSNILVDAAGDYRLADFSLALYADELAHLTSLRYLDGTPAYLPPEARDARYATFEPGYAMDVYALGLTLLETVTGRFLPSNFSGKENVSRLLGIRDEGWMRFFRRALEKDGNAQWQLERLAAIVNKATAVDPGERYANGGDLYRDVEELLTPDSVGAVVANVPLEPPPSSRRSHDLTTRVASFRNG